MNIYYFGFHTSKVRLKLKSVTKADEVRISFHTSKVRLKH